MLSFRNSVVIPKYTFFDGKIREGIEIRVDGEGRIEEIGEGIRKKDEKVIRCENELFLPGFVNAHSHAFHRFLRGKSSIGKNSSTTFWGWRDDMYALVRDISKQQLTEYCTRVFSEMLSCGITCVGEFHYVHHGEGLFDLDECVLDAARHTGIRLVLLNTLYQRGGFHSPPLHPSQKRFISTFDQFIQHLHQLDKVRPPNATIAVASHSLRAVDPTTTKQLLDWAKANKKVFHIHLEEQPKEIEDCLEVEGRRPAEILLDIGVDESVTVVHCSFTSRENMEEMEEKGVNVCVCPCTEGYLGDGVPDLSQQTNLCIGSDCNSRIAFFEEMRWMEFSQATKHNCRSIAQLTADRLFHAATAGGAISLGLSDQTGTFKKDAFFDFATINIQSILIQGIAKDELLDAIVFSVGNKEISRVGVAGSVLYTNTSDI